MNKLQSQSQRFEGLAAKALAAGGYRVERETRFRINGQTLAIDAVAQLGDEDLLIEFKWTRLNPVPLKMLRDWAARFSIYKTLDPEAEFVLIVSGRVNASHRDWIKQQFNVDVWDAEQLAFLARGNDGLLAQLSDFQKSTAQLETERLTGRQGRLEEGSPSESTGIRENSSRENLGQDLIKRLEATPAGRSNSTDYEKLCIEIINYLFGDYLSDARPQSRTEDGLNIMDVVYRVRQRHSFWEILTRDFRSRVVVFEFKNYSESIGPQQVYSTERYLSASALRSVCFLVSRRPPLANAELAAFGALRESGKLLVFLDDNDLQTMLRFRDAELAALLTDQAVEDDASVVLDQKIYQFLATMGR